MPFIREISTFLPLLAAVPHHVLEVAALSRHLGLNAAPATIDAPADKPNGGEAGEDTGIEAQNAGEPHQDDDQNEGHGNEEDQQAIEVGQIPQGLDLRVDGVRLEARKKFTHLKTIPKASITI